MKTTTSTNYRIMNLPPGVAAFDDMRKIDENCIEWQNRPANFTSHSSEKTINGASIAVWLRLTWQLSVMASGIVCLLLVKFYNDKKPFLRSGLIKLNLLVHSIIINKLIKSVSKPLEKMQFLMDKFFGCPETANTDFEKETFLDEIRVLGDDGKFNLSDQLSYLKQILRLIDDAISRIHQSFEQLYSCIIAAEIAKPVSNSPSPSLAITISSGEIELPIEMETICNKKISDETENHSGPLIQTHEKKRKMDIKRSNFAPKRNSPAVIWDWSMTHLQKQWEKIFPHTWTDIRKGEHSP